MPLRRPGPYRDRATSVAGVEIGRLSMASDRIVLFRDDPNLFTIHFTANEVNWIESSHVRS